MKNIVVLLVVFLSIVCLSVKETNAQLVDGAYERVDLEEKEPMALPYVREADVMWSKRIWRIVDLKEKMNQVLYYPTQSTDGRVNLINVLMDAVENNYITAYDASSDQNGTEFNTPLRYSEVVDKFDASSEVIERRNLETGELEQDTVFNEFRPEEVKQYMVKEEWYFDKSNSTMNVRIIGLCPIRVYENDLGVMEKTKLFWIYYPESRNILANNPVINVENTAEDISFDDLFIKRKFDSYIVGESNVYNNRSINQYLKGREASLEAQRIEQEIFNYEQDLWEY